MPTLAGLRRRGVPPEAIRDFGERIGVAKANSVVDVGMLEFCDPRGAQHDGAAAHGGAAAAQGGDRELSGRRRSRSSRPSTIPRIPRRARARSPFARELYIERDDFMEDPPKKFFRLSPGREVRLRYAYFVTCTRGGQGRGRRGRRAALHLRSGDRAAAMRPTAARSRRPCTGCRRRMRCRPKCASTIRCSQSPIRTPRNFVADLNPQSLEVLADARLEPAIAATQCRRARCSSSGRAISVRDRGFRRRTVRSSTAPSVCAIPSPRKSAARPDLN